VLLQAPFKQHFCVVTDDVRLALAVNRANSARALVLDLICSEEDPLAEKVCQHVECANVLHAPVKSV